MQSAAASPSQTKGAMLPALAVAGFAIVGSGAALHMPPATGEMGVVFAPWTEQSEAFGAIVAAGGYVVDSGRFSNVMIAYGADPGFAARIRAEGAWLVLAATGLCAPAE